MWHNLSIARKFGLLYLFLVAFLATFGIVVLFHVGEMRQDADRLLEETREHAIAQRMMGRLSVIKSLTVEDARLAAGDELRGAMASEQVEALFLALSKLHDPSLDPSRPEHQAIEDQYIASALGALEILRTSLKGIGSTHRMASSEQPLEAVRSCIQYFVDETREEVERSDVDLEKSARAARSVTVGTWIAMTLVLCIALGLVYRTIIAPLRHLREGADRLGSGDLEHRIKLRNQDELGRLASSFNTMADRIGATQGHLEERIAERTRELIRAARLADIGVLAAGVAHEINTPLASIAACAEGLTRRSKKGELLESDLQEYLQTITDEAYRAHQTTQQLLALSRQDHGEVVDVDLALILEQVEKAVKPLLQMREVHLDCSYELDGIQLSVNEIELTQVLVNLIMNAKDASSKGDAVQFSCERSGDSVVFEVKDHGHGIAAEDIDRVFTPFYTTKAPGAGTGLGLSLAANIVEMRSGRISVKSTPGEGSCFRVELPMGWKGKA